MNGRGYGCRISQSRAVRSRDGISTPPPTPRANSLTATARSWRSPKTEAERGNDPRPSLAERYPGTAYADTVRTVTQALLNHRLLLREDAEHYVRRDGSG